MNKSLWTLLVFFFVFILLNGQDAIIDDAPDSLNTNSRSDLMVHYYLIPHLHFNRPTLKIGLEPKVNENWGVNISLGYINKNFYVFRNTHNYNRGLTKKNGLNGYYVSVEPKFYPYVNTQGKRSNTFISLSLDMHDQDEIIEDWVFRNGGSYLQKMEYIRYEKSYTQMIHWGKSIAKLKVVNLNLSVGMGHRFINVTNNLPSDAEGINTNAPRRAEATSGKRSRFAVKVSLFLTFPSTENGHRPN